ncbi:MAG: ABC transporter ATP-binding protein [Clostridia bacterium]|nr:ABC transporter ATP-binding protein [Clostridia bacterium]
MLKLEHITKTFFVGDEPVYALRDVNLHVKPYEFVAICGPSGSGKTTLMNIMGCLDTADTGSYLLDGIDINDCTDEELSDIRSRKIGFVFQQFNLLPQMSALENVELPMIYQKVPARERMQRAKAALEMVGLENRIHHTPEQLSGGQQQRVAIARALASNQSGVILADEPTGNLDTKSGNDIMQYFTDLAANKTHTVILITHNPEIAEQAQRTVFVRDGILYEKAGENEII